MRVWPDLPLFVSKSPKAGCCAAFSEASFVDYAGGMVRFEINEDSPTFKFDSGVSHFAAVRVNPQASESILETATTTRGMYLPLATLFVPSFSFLDSAYRQLAAAEPLLYQNTGKFDDTRGGTFYGACAIPAGTRQIVIFSDMARLSERVLHLHGGGAGADQYLAHLRDQYKAVPAASYAAGRVPRLASRGLIAHEIERRPTGEVRFSLSTA